MNLENKNAPAPSHSGQQHDHPRDHQIDAALQALNSVQPAARFEQRVHARLAQTQETEAASSGWSNSLDKLAGLFSWPRAAFALATFTAGVLAASFGLPMLHRAPIEPVTSHMLNGSATAAPASSTGTATTEPPAVHPGFTVRTPDGRAAALNTQGTVATIRSRNAHSDTQLAGRQTDRIHARLAKPVRPKAGQAAASASPSTDPTDQPDKPAPASPATPAGSNSPQ